MIIQTETVALEEKGWATARQLAEALPYIQIYDREIVTIKYGGHAMGEAETARVFASDIVLLKLLGKVMPLPGKIMGGCGRIELCVAHN